MFNDLEDNESSSRRRKANESSKLPWIIVAVLALAGGAIAIYFATGGSKSKTGTTASESVADARNKDYLPLVEIANEMRVIVELKEGWIAPDAACLKDAEAKKSIGWMMRYLDSEFEAREAVLVNLRGVFLEKHGISSKDWKADFEKQFPERELINDQIAILAKNASREQIMEASGFLLGKFEKLEERAFNKMRDEYLSKKTPIFLKDTLARANKLELVEKLRKKIRQ